MKTGITEIVGLFLIVVGAAGLVAAAALVSVPLAVAVASALVILGGVIAVYVANAIDSAQVAKTNRDEP